MATAEVVHSFLQETPLERNEYLNENICVRFIRKKFKCLMIFFLTIIIIGETFIVINEKVNFNVIFDQFFKSNMSIISSFTSSRDLIANNSKS